MSNFKIILLAVFIGFGLFGILVFADIIKIGGGGSDTEPEGSVTIWGTVSAQAIRPFFDDFDLRYPKISTLYVQKQPDTFSNELVEAIASNTAPDIVLLHDSYIWRFDNKMVHIPYTTLPQRTFTDTFASGAGIFLAPDGVVAIPFAVDPLVMYYNKTLLEAEGYAQPPTTWQELADSAERLTKRTSDLSITQNAVAMGAYQNITHVKDVLALLFMTNDNKFITRSAVGIEPHFGTTATGVENTAAEQASSFFLAFSDPTTDVYSWNAGEPRDRDAFVQGRLAYYFGPASELPTIRALNPNLYFDIALPPRSTTGLPLSVGHFYGLAIPRSARDQNLSYAVATLLTDAVSAEQFVETTSTTLTLLPVRRTLLGNRPADDPYLSLLYATALVARPWLDPQPDATNAIFRTFINDINSGFLTIDQSLDKAAAQLQSL